MIGHLAPALKWDRLGIKQNFLTSTPIEYPPDKTNDTLKKMPTPGLRRVGFFLNTNGYKLEFENFKDPIRHLVIGCNELSKKVLHDRLLKLSNIILLF